MEIMGNLQWDVLLTFFSNSSVENGNYVALQTNILGQLQTASLLILEHSFSDIFR